MKAKKKFIHRLAAFGCALIVAASCLFGSVSYYADVSYPSVDDLYGSDYHYIIVKYNGDYFYISSNSIIYDNSSLCEYGDCISHLHADCVVSGQKRLYLYAFDTSNNEWERVSSCATTGVHCVVDKFRHLLYEWYGTSYYDYTDLNELNIIYSSHDILDNEGNVVINSGVQEDSTDSDVYNSSLGYLQNISYKTLYLRGDGTYYYDDESRKDIWSYDATTTTGLDLTTGNYSIRHYIQPCLVKNYEDDGVIEKYDKYLMGEYDAAGLSLEYLRSDYEDKLAEYGYEGLGFIDSLLGRFILEHHYFQIVNNDTNEVGGYVLIKPKNADKSSFGVEHVGLTVDENGEVDPDGYGETIIDKDTGAGSTYEEAEENAEQVTIDELGGVEAFTATIHNFSDSLGNVPLAIKSLLELFPWWVLSLFGFSFALAFLVMLLKFGR